MILYHGTTRENAEMIIRSGELLAPVYFTDRFNQAEEYALNNDPDGVVISIDVNVELTPDMESTLGEHESFSNSNIPVCGAKFIYYRDYERE